MSPSDPGGTIVTRYGSPPPAIEAAIREYWPQSEWVNIAEVGYLESGWRADAYADTTWRAGGLCGVRYLLPDGTPALTEKSAGWLQVNICAHGMDRAHWSDPSNASRKGYDLYVSRGYKYGAWWISAGKLGLPR